MVGILLSEMIWNKTCGDTSYTYGNLRFRSFFLLTSLLCGTYMLVFSVSYLETGLKMVFLDNDAYKWAR